MSLFYAGNMFLKIFVRLLLQCQVFFPSKLGVNKCLLSSKLQNKRHLEDLRNAWRTEVRVFCVKEIEGDDYDAASDEFLLSTGCESNNKDKDKDSVHDTIVKKGF